MSGQVYGSKRIRTDVDGRKLVPGSNEKAAVRVLWFFWQKRTRLGSLEGKSLEMNADD